MNDKEREVDNICLSYRHDFGLMSHSQKEVLRGEARSWLHAAENNGYRHAPDRVTGRFTKEGFLKHIESSGIKIAQYDEIVANLAAEYASTLETEPSQPPVEGGLTREWLRKTFDHPRLNNLDQFIDAIFSRIQSDRAAIRENIESAYEDVIKSRERTITALRAELDTVNNALAEQSVISAQRALELDTLKANSIAVPKVWPDHAECFVTGFSANDVETTQRFTSIRWVHSVIPRPIPETREMTVRQMIDALKGRYASPEDFLEALADDKLTMLDKLRKLMEDAGLPTTRRG